MRARCLVLACLGWQATACEAMMLPEPAANSRGAVPSGTGTGGTPASSTGPSAQEPNAGDANMTAATPPAGLPSACDGASFRLCDDFEADALGGPPDPNRWNVEKSTTSFAPEPPSATPRPPGNANEVVEITDARAKRGKQSLHFHASNVGLEHVVVSNTSFFPVPNNTFFGRVFIFFPNSNPLPIHHVSLVETDGPAGNVTSQGGNRIYTRFGMDFGGEVQFNWLGNDANVHGSTTLPRDAWTCFELEFKGDTNEWHAWMNEQPLPALDVQNNRPAWTAPTWSRLQLGWEIYQRDPTGAVAFDIYYDGVAFDTQRIGCTH